MSRISTHEMHLFKNQQLQTDVNFFFIHYLFYCIRSLTSCLVVIGLLCVFIQFFPLIIYFIVRVVSSLFHWLSLNCINGLLHEVIWKVALECVLSSLRMIQLSTLTMMILCSKYYSFNQSQLICYLEMHAINNQSYLDKILLKLHTARVTQINGGLSF